MGLVVAKIRFQRIDSLEHLRASRQALPKAYHRFVDRFVPVNEIPYNHPIYRHGILEYMKSLRRRSASWRDFVVVPVRYGQGNESEGGNGNGIRGMLGEVLGRPVLSHHLSEWRGQFHAPLELLPGPQIGATDPYHPAAKLSDAMIGVRERNLTSPPRSPSGVFHAYFEADVKVMNPRRLDWVLGRARRQFDDRWRDYWMAHGKIRYPKYPHPGEFTGNWSVRFHEKSGIYRLLLIPKSRWPAEGSIQKGMRILHLPADFETFDAAAKEISREALLSDRRPRTLSSSLREPIGLLQDFPSGLEFYSRDDAVAAEQALRRQFDHLLDRQVLQLEFTGDHVNLLRGPNWERRGFRFQR